MQVFCNQEEVTYYDIFLPLDYSNYYIMDIFHVDKNLG